MPLHPAHRGRQVQHLRGRVEQHDARARRPGTRHLALGPQLAAQPQREIPHAAANRLGVTELKHLPPLRTPAPDGDGVAAVQHRVQPSRGQPRPPHPHPQRGPAIPDADRRSG